MQLQATSYEHKTIPPWKTTSHRSATASMEALPPLLETSTTEGKADTTLAMLRSFQGCMCLGRKCNEKREKVLRAVRQKGLCWWLRPGTL